MKKLKKDKFTRARDGNSKLLKISCSKCNTNILTYQKDGIGALRRLYLDRIQDQIAFENLICPNCKNLIGVTMIYKKENRPAIRLIQGTFIKKTV